MKFVCCAGLAVVWFMIAVPASAQEEFVLQGTVLASKGQPVEGAYVTLAGTRKYAISDIDGSFTISGLSPKTYTLHISHVAFNSAYKTIPADSLTGNIVIYLKPKRYQSSTVVVTATRTRRDIEEVPEPVTVISDKEIKTSGSTRLSNILAEQTGLMLVSNHGTGIQLQGLSSAYTKVMIDGQPLIGRTAGTLNLDRISIGNVRQIEMVKGPSSALWGSDALAGVINIITDKARKPFALGVNSRYATNQALDFGLNLSSRRDDWSNNLFLNRNSSQGYSLQDNSISQTAPPYQNYTASYQTSWDITDAVEAGFKGRYYRETQSSTDYLGSDQNPTLLDGDALEESYSLTPSLSFTLPSGLKGEISNYYSKYRTDSKYEYQQGDSLYEQSAFNQLLNKTELQLSERWNLHNTTTLGGGYKYERLKADRYPSRPSFNSFFGYFQHEWMPSQAWDLIAGLRYDIHSEYKAQLSPKFSAGYKPVDWLHLRASAGSGFKAPDFRELFLDFTNPTVGYTVFGSSTAQQRMQELQNRGQISRILIPLSQLSEISAEKSWAYNAGIDLFPTSTMSLRLNAFKNDINNLIESAPVAAKTNGQLVYTYFNLEKVYTRGIEAQIRWKPAEQLELSGGYQLLDARRRITETRKIVNSEGQIEEKAFSAYKPMFNRSKHSANIKLFYIWKAADIDANIRGSWHGRYGRVDANGNGFVDSSEYENGYMLWNASLAKTFKKRYTLRLGADNIFNFTRPGDLSYLSGRIFYARLSLQLF